MTLKEKIKKYAIPADVAFAHLRKDPRYDQKLKAKIHYFETLMNLRKTRIKKRLTQTKLAQLSGIPRTTIVKIESGRRNTTIETLMTLAEAMGKTLEIRLK